MFDPTCGTGGFLVSAFDRIKSTASEEQIYEFKNKHIYGVEQDAEIVSLALVNMIFRGDGKSNIYEGNTLNSKFKKISSEYKKIDLLVEEDIGETFITKVLMNPPFAIENEEEYRFVNHALSQMVRGGMLFAILPTSTITSASDAKGEITWRKELLKRHTIKAVIKLSDELFCPVASKGTYAIIIEAHKPQDFNQEVLFAIMDDGYTMKKAKRVILDNLPSNIKLIKQKVREFTILNNKIDNIEKVIGLSKLNTDDDSFDLAPESYLQASSDFSMTFEITTNLLQAFINRDKHKFKQSINETNEEIKVFDILEFFSSIKRGKCPPINSLKEGNIPVITTTELNNGIVGYYDIPVNIIDTDCITISANGSSCCAFYQPYKFTANADVLICKLKQIYNNLYFKIFLCTAIRSSAWKFTYYRKCSNTKLLKDVKIKIPIKNQQIDYELIKSKVENSIGFDLLKSYLSSI
ncbi:hypothetical protein H6P87_00581 [Rickettsia tillamookensis]|uniref:site-specific DNA-methyltransferase (adenine-specific) n=1 Tax=Rickettsia tillamookensis TaxID=2761623 RepID=A0A9E6MHF1_9RICK|nr:hypothetical protein H6P87_00581 [Rickettsia tillamookensis]